jgi:hypothetical protein
MPQAKSINKLSTTLAGAAGEHFVMGELLRRGVIAALAPAGAPNMDILITDISGHKLAAIQVKTRRKCGSDDGWHMSKKHESIIDPAIFYVFVDLAADIPVYYIVPSEVVATVVKTQHEIWLRKPSKSGKLKATTEMRRFSGTYDARRWSGISADDEIFVESHLQGWLDQYRGAWENISSINSH